MRDFKTKKRTDEHGLTDLTVDAGQKNVYFIFYFIKVEGTILQVYTISRMKDLKLYMYNGYVFVILF